MKHCLCLLIAISLGSALATAADWPHGRGPNYDGVSEELGLLDAWPAEGPRRLWSRELGQGHSGIIIGGGRLFTQRQSAAGQFLLCLDPLTGETLWETRYARPWQSHGAYPGPYATPTYCDGRVYFASPTGLVGCIDAGNGAILWSLDLHERFAGRGFSFGFAATPLVEEGRVYLPAGGPKASMVALDALTGATIWAVGSDPASYCPALPINLGKRRCIVGYRENAVLIVDATNGAIVHRQRLSTGYDEHSAWPLYREPHLLLTAPFRAAASCLHLEDGADDKIAAKQLWSSRQLSNDVASSVLYKNSVYGFDLKQLQSSAHRASRGVFRCLDWTTGITRWSTERVGHATVLAADDKLFLLTDEGDLILARADSADYEEISRTSLFPDEICWTPPSLCDGRLYVRSPSRLICLDVADRKFASIPQMPRERTNAGWRVDPSWLLSREREYPNDAPTLRETKDWFVASLFLTSLAAFATIGIDVVMRRRFARPISIAGTFLTIAFILGWLGPNLMSTLADRCLFTWPLSVFAVLHGAARLCMAEPSDRFKSRWQARACILLLVLTCAGYYALCRIVGMPIGRYYLFGLPVALPFSAWAAYVEQQRYSYRAAFLTLLSFAAFFGTGQALVMWQGIS